MYLHCDSLGVNFFPSEILKQLHFMYFHRLVSCCIYMKVDSDNWGKFYVTLLEAITIMFSFFWRQNVRIDKLSQSHHLAVKRGMECENLNTQLTSRITHMYVFISSGEYGCLG